MPETELLIATGVLSEANVDAIRQEFPSVTVHVQPAATADELDASLAEHPGVTIAVSDVLPRRSENLRRLEWLQVTAVGIDQRDEASGRWGDLDHPALTAPNVALTTAAGLPAAAMAEYVVWAMLDHHHRCSGFPSYREDRSWARRPDLAADTLVGRQVGLIGYGAVGRRVATVAKTLGMTVVSHHPGSGRVRYALPLFADLDDRHDVSNVSLVELLDTSDVIVVAAPLTPATAGVLSDGEFAATKVGAMIVNVARGGVVDEKALIDALTGGRLSAAYLDVTEREPLPPDDPLWDAPNVVLSPHVSGVYSQVGDFTTMLVRENLDRWLNGGASALLNVFDRSQGY
jgi:phosphoglycerate dehydrogenase-like enzyme